MYDLSYVKLMVPQVRCKGKQQWYGIFELFVWRLFGPAGGLLKLLLKKDASWSKDDLQISIPG